MISLKNKLQNNSLTIGTWLSIGSSAVAEVLCQSGFDWITVDMEHSPITLFEAQEVIRTIDLCGKIPAVRVGENNPNLIKRVLDAGAYAIIVPMVNTKEEAQRAVDAAKYPPTGKRGVGLARAQKYGFGFEEYKEFNEKECVVVVQIEHIDAINNLEDILSVKGIDATFIGPYDLSGSLGHPGNFDFPEFKKALKKYEDISRKLKIPMGYHVVEPDIDTIQARIENGYRFLAVGLDTLFLGRKCRETLEKINNVKEG